MGNNLFIDEDAIGSDCLMETKRFDRLGLDLVLVDKHGIKKVDGCTAISESGWQWSIVLELGVDGDHRKRAGFIGFDYTDKVNFLLDLGLLRFDIASPRTQPCSVASIHLPATKTTIIRRKVGTFLIGKFCETRRRCRGLVATAAAAAAAVAIVETGCSATSSPSWDLMKGVLEIKLSEYMVVARSFLDHLVGVLGTGDELVQCLVAGEGWIQGKFDTLVESPEEVARCVLDVGCIALEVEEFELHSVIGNRFIALADGLELVGNVRIIVCPSMLQFECAEKNIECGFRSHRGVGIHVPELGVSLEVLS
jgi:hypothetical protein